MAHAQHERDGATAPALADRMRERKRVYRQLLDQCPEGLGVLIDGRFAYANDAAQRLYGRTTRLVGEPWDVNVAPDDRPRLLAVLQRLQDQLAAEGGNVTVPYAKRIIRSEGTERFVEGTVTGGLTLHGRPALLVAGRDVTDRRAIEVQLLRAQGLDAMSRLAGSVAHDVNNLLTVVATTAELAQRDFLELAQHLVQQVGAGGATDARVASIAADLDEIRQAARRGAAITRQLLAFGRRQVLSPAVLDLTAVVAGVEGLLRRALGRRIDVVFRPDAAPVAVYADRGQLEQVLMNLVVNARDAMPDGGTLTIATAPEPGAGVLQIRDTGIGMDDTTRERAFEPFFTTKPEGQGTGLGLASVYGVVRQSGGTVELTSAPGSGTTVTIRLPSGAREADARRVSDGSVDGEAM